MFLGFCYGFKIHLIVTEIGQVVDFKITSANIDDRKPLQVKGFIKKLWGKLFGDKGYISASLFLGLFYNGIYFVI